MIIVSILLITFHILNERFGIAHGFISVRHRLISHHQLQKFGRDDCSQSRKRRNNDDLKLTPLFASSVDNDSKPMKNITKTKIAKATKIRDNVQSAPETLLSSETFNLFCGIHCTLTLLRKYFPVLLDLPPISTPIAQQWIYNSNITITGPKDEELAVGFDEVMGITRALAVVTTAARRAGNLFDMAVAGGRSANSPGSVSVSNAVECEMIMDDHDPFQVLVLWRTRLPQPSLGSNDKQYTEISGRSALQLSSSTGRIKKLQIQKVQINGVTIIESLGSALATIRSTARSSPLFETLSGPVSSTGSSSGNPLLDGILSGIRDVVDAVDSLPSSPESGGTDDGCPLYILPKNDWKNASFPALEKSSNEVLSTLTPIDLFSSKALDVKSIVVGSESFVEYAMLHKSLVNFEKYGLYQLAGSGRDTIKEEIRSLFTSDARLISSSSENANANGGDHTTLLKGAGNVADLYRSLALFRQTSGGDWSVKNTEINLKDQSLVVKWETKSPLKIEGSDKFTFEKPWIATSPIRLPVISDGDNDVIVQKSNDFFDETDTYPLKINQIENLNLTVGGMTADSDWASSFISAALRTGLGNAPIPDPTISELLRALANRQSTSSKSQQPPKVKQSAASMMPLLDDAAAIAFYGIIRALHIDLSNIANLEIKSTTPAGMYLADDVELRGLLREKLISGSQGYNRLIGVAVSSLRAALQTGRVRLAAPPKPIIEVTSRGSIKVDFLLALWIDAPTFGSPSGGFGVPLKIQLVSEYIIGPTGKIQENVILESRLNGVLTPGDVFSRWIKDLTSSSEKVDVTDGMPAALEQLVGALNWVKSVQNRNKK